MSYQTPDATKWEGRDSDEKAYWHQKIVLKNLESLTRPEKTSCVILGYASDEGVKRNQGRPGAKLGPDAIRNRLAKLSDHPGLFNELIDAGNIVCEENDLEQAQMELSSAVYRLLSMDYFPLLLGGGHDIAYPNYTGLRKFLGDKSIGIVNLDAHFDLRKPEGKGNSGTPFYQIAEDCKASGHDFKYLCLGVQPLSNTEGLYKTAEKLNVKYVERKKFTSASETDVLKEVNDFLHSVDHIYLTIDLDGFAASISPGVSAPSPFGFEIDISLKVIDALMDSGKVSVMDIAEMNPDYDIDGHSARLAAYLIGYALQR